MGRRLELACMRDAGRLAELSRDLIETGLDWRWRADRIAAMIRAADVNVLVARGDGTDGSAAGVVGFGIMQYDAAAAYLNLLAVQPAQRRTGIAGELLGWLEQTALVAGCQSVALHVRSDNAAARAFYARRGYAVMQRIAGYYQGRESALRLQRRLREAEPAFALQVGGY